MHYVPMFHEPMADLVAQVLLALLCAAWYRSYLAMRPHDSLLLGALAIGGTVAWLYLSNLRVIAGSPFYLSRDYETPLMASIAFLALMGLGMGLVAKVYRAWVLDRATDVERLPNAKSLRAWLGPMNVVSALGVVVCAYYALGWSPWATAAGAFGLLLAYPAVNGLMGEGLKPGGDAEAAEERRRVLALVESGKITAEDGAELLSALGQSQSVSAMRDDSGAISGNRRAMLLGAALLLMGFFLPWLTVNVGQELRGVMSSLMSQTPHMAQSGGNGPYVQVEPDGTFRVSGGPNSNFGMSGNMPQVPADLVVTVRGGDLAYRLGWFIMLLGMAVAVLPLVWPTRSGNRQSQRGVSLVALGAGTILVLYVASGVVTSSGVGIALGLVLVLAGYAVMWAGAIREYVRRPAAGMSAVAFAR